MLREPSITFISLSKVETPKAFKGRAILPKYYRFYIVRTRPMWVMQRIDRATKFYEWFKWRYPKNHKENREAYARILVKYKIPESIVNKIYIGTMIYDASPMWLKYLLKKL